MSLPRIGCNGYVDCINDCFMNSADTTEFMMCRANTCDKQVISAGRTRFNAALGCGQAWCLGLNDMGPGDCVLNGNMLAEPPGTTDMRCQKCLANAVASLFKEMCADMASPNCNPASCQDEVMACHTHPNP